MSFIDLKTIPFSYKNAYFVISLTQEHQLVIRDIRGGDLNPGHLFYLIPECTYRFIADATLLTLYNEADESVVLQITFQSPELLRITTNGHSIQLKAIQRPYEQWCQVRKKEWQYASYFKEMKYSVHCIKGEVKHMPKENALTFNGEIILERYKVVSQLKMESVPPFHDLVDLNRSRLMSWTHAFSNKEPDDLLQRAATVLWNNFVGPEGRLKYPALYMTKNWMTNIWSWDNCFSAIGLCRVDLKSALEQIWIFESLQDDSGALPDYTNDVYASFSCTKPPILGWTYRQMAKRNPEIKKDETILRRFYAMAKGQVRYFLEHRMSDIGLPFYTHGNDSGWDNGTFYTEGVPIVAPDLTVYLLDQLEFLIEAAETFRDYKASEEYKALNRQLLDALQKHLWKRGQFRAIKLPEMKVVDSGNTLQRLTPLMISHLLPESITLAMLDDLSQFVTPLGLATEALDSTYYTYNGYWRGPIWAPVMLMMIESLKSMQKDALYRPLIEGFFKCVEVGGFAENFDPITGEGLVDTGFAWTCAVYATLRQDLENDIINEG